MPHPRHAELDELTFLSSYPLAAVLEIATLEEVAEAWCTFMLTFQETTGDHPDEWGIQFFRMQELFANEDLHRAALTALFRAAEGNPRLYGSIGAGPLEDYLPQTEQDFRWLEQLARELPGVREAVATLWVSRDLEEWQLQRLDRIAGEPLTRAQMD